jgi:hypothetical protein
VTGLQWKSTAFRGMVGERRFGLFLRFQYVSGSGRFLDCRHNRRAAVAGCSQKGEECDQRRPRIGQAEILARYALALIEVRSIENAGEVHYAKHAHETFSIGAITYAGLSRNVAAGQRAGRQHHQNHVVLLHFAKFLAKENVRLAVQF